MSPSWSYLTCIGFVCSFPKCLDMPLSTNQMPYFRFINICTWKLVMRCSRMTPLMRKTEMHVSMSSGLKLKHLHIVSRDPQDTTHSLLPNKDYLVFVTRTFCKFKFTIPLYFSIASPELVMGLNAQLIWQGDINFIYFNIKRQKSTFTLPPQEYSTHV